MAITSIRAFAEDLVIGSMGGEKELKDTIKRIEAEWFSESSSSYEDAGNAVGGTNQACWFFYEKKNPKFSEICGDAYYKFKDLWWDKFGKNKDAINWWYDNID